MMAVLRSSAPDRDYADLPHVVRLQDLRLRGRYPYTPRECVDAYWYRHLGRAWRLSMALARRSARWGKRLIIHCENYRHPPLPFMELNGVGCNVCGQKVYGLGWHRPIEGYEPKASWHAACYRAYQFMVNPGGALGLAEGFQADHFIPFYRVARDCNWAWPHILEFWGPTNIQILTREEHARKSAREARERAKYRRAS